MRPALFARIALGAFLTPLLHAQISAVEPGSRQLLNGREIGHELKIPPGTEAAVTEYFPSFFEYQDLMLFHPRIGYYASGLVDFRDDFSTYPNTLAPYFGQMIAEQTFRMWAGMRKAGTLRAAEQFTIAEFGAGNGALAESILDYLDQQSKYNADARWREFARQAVYACYDRSPAMNKAQRGRNERFGKHFEAREGDATNLAPSIVPGSLKGLILSNEMLDNFSVHKVILSSSGAAEVAYVVPSLSTAAWSELKKYVPEPVQARIESDDRAIGNRFSASGQEAPVYLSRAALVALLESLSALPDYRVKLKSIEFSEIYLPVSLVSELSEHLRRHARPYAYELAKAGKGVVAYINLGEAKYISGAGRALAAGYVLTIDYGSSWDGITTFGPYGKLRTYGPGSSKEKPDPYGLPTLNDITTDVNFGHLDAEGRIAGLKTAYFGYQRALQTGTPISLDHLPSGRPLTNREVLDFKTWSAYFRTVRAFKALVQQKENTDPSYAFPNHDPLPLEVDETSLTPLQREQAAEIERRLRSAHLN